MTQTTLDNPFRQKAQLARARADALAHQTPQDRAMAQAFPLGAGFGRRGGSRRLAAHITRAVAAGEALKRAEYLEAQADAFDGGAINAHGRHVTAASQLRSDKRAAVRERRQARIDAARAQREGKEPWQVSGTVWADAAGLLAGPGRDLVLAEHREAVAQAVRAGKPVPDEVA